MWRKHDEPKAPSQAPEKRVPAPAVSNAPSSASHAPAAAAATSPAVKHLTSALVIKGEITGRGDLCIDGEVSGEIRLDDGTVTIGPEGRVEANIHAREIVVRGHVHGNLIGRERVQIGASGHASGNVLTRLISIEEGAELHGEVEVTRGEDRLTPRSSAHNSNQQPTAYPMRSNQSAIGA